MATRQNSKSQKIRDYLAAHPGASAADVAKATRTKVGLVYAVKAKSSNGKAKRKKGDQFAGLILARKLADQLGGVEQAREAVNALAKLL